jgi:hypothetical protein
MMNPKIVSILFEDQIQGSTNTAIGLGDDGKLYEWDIKVGSWILWVNK